MTSRQFAQQMVSTPPTNANGVLQRRPLAVNTPGDRFEREADRVADAVVSGQHQVAPFSLSAVPIAAVPIARVQREDAPKEKTDADKLKEAGDKLKDAFLATPLGKDLQENVKQDKLVKGATEAGKSFIATLPGKIITGAAAAGAVATLAALHKELPAQIPEIPLDVLTPGLSVEITYKGPVDKPTEAMITFKFTEQASKGSGDKKPAMTDSEKFRAETARIAADQAKFRAGMKYPPGSPEDLQQKAEDAAAKSALAKYAPGPDLDAMVKKYPWMGAQQPKGGLQLTQPTPSFGYKPPSLLGDEYKLKLPGEKKKEDEPTLQRKAVSDATVSAAPPVVHEALASSGQPLDTGTRTFMEARFGHDFGQVRVHTDARASESARAVNAMAYTVGRDIVFAPGQFAPESHSGRHLLAHELTHVVQQSGSDGIRVSHSNAKGDLSPARFTHAASAPTTAPAVFRAVNPTPVVRLNRTALLGDGTPANLGITLGGFQGYLSKQADWFVEPTLTAADRKQLWDLALLLQEGDHIGAGLANLNLADLAAAPAADMALVRAYAAGAAPTAQTVRITRPDAKIARVIELGKAMLDLATIVPGPVLRVCIDQTGLETLVDEKLVPVLKTYYTTFAPTIENPAEQDPLLTLLRGGIAPFATLTDWVHDLHIFTPATRAQLVPNVADKSRKRPVLLVLMSGLDWNSAFLQAANLESAVRNPTNLALVLQGAKTLVNETARVNQTADDYGQIPKSGGKARLGQVVIAGHGQATSVEQTTSGAGAASTDDQTVSYNQADINPTKPGDDSELLIDAVLSRMDPADARVVFAGCLVGSHDVPETPTLANVKTAAAEINAALKANPNLRDLVNQRMAALKVKGTVQAANASTTFDAFNLNAAGKARLSLTWDPDIGGAKADYVKTGSEPEGALRAALETWADPKLGPTWTTKEMRKHVAAKAASNDWYVSLTRTAYKLALPAAGDVDPALINNLAHRVESWLLAGWESMANAASLAGAVKAAEVPVLYPVMLASDHAADPHLGVVVEQAWMQADAAHEPAFLAAVDATTLKRLKLTPLLAAGMVDPHLAALLKTPDPAKPSRPQLLLALVVAVNRGNTMPAPVQTLLSDAAGGKRTTTFPAVLGVQALLDGASELEVLRNIGLAPGAPPSKGAPPLLDDANADLDKNKTNETFISVKPREATIVGATVLVRAQPNSKAKDIGKFNAGDVARVVGTTAGWTAVDLNGKIGFVDGSIP